MIGKQSKATKARTASLKDVAVEAGVSMAAVSYALNGKRGIAADTRARILAAIDRLNYQPSKFARRMRTGKSDAIGLVVPDLTNPFFPQFARSVQHAAREAGNSVFLVDTNNDAPTEQAGVHNLISHGIDGIIWWPTALGNCAEFNDAEIPVVYVDSRFDHRDSITSDHYSGGKLIAALVNASTRRRIGLVRGPSSFATAALRRNGFVENLSPDVEIVWELENAFAPPLSPELITRAMQRDVDAIICPSDLIACELLRTLHESGIAVPGEVAVTGFGGTIFADLVSPGLTTIVQPLDELGKQAMEMLSRRIACPTTPPRDVTLPVTILTRGSFPC